ncbi:hypothetical protein niasHT_031340 [Heterodera trifolii]|uniref:Uncharacterized protein n=1 Tax=Heterodera trifolii TaxID=157864 RepID=A0ABD2IRJ1_9BILA
MGSGRSGNGKSTNLPSTHEPILLNDDYDNNVDAQEGGEDALDKLGTVLLTAVPVLHGWQLDRDDIDQLLSMLSELPGIVHRPSKVRKIFASKACRHSVMFGKALTQREMETVGGQKTHFLII